MGCDIHVHVEYRKQENGDWICGDYFKLNPCYPDFEDETEYSLVGFCDDRCYGRFAVLANVRNYGNTQYISKPRGLPYDVTKSVKDDAERFGMDGHSHSYLTLRELIDFNNSKIKQKRRGMISPEAQKALEIGVFPTEWCQSTNIPGWEWREWEVDNDCLVPMIEALKVRADELYCIYEWLWDRDYKKAYELSNNIRIVFWFDN